jgi:hypothetical protein
MFPWVFEWQWEPGHYALLGAWYCVLTVVGVTLGYVFIKTVLGLRKPDEGHGGHGEEHGAHH